MSDVPYAKVIVSVDGVAQANSFVTPVLGGAAIRLRGENTSGWTSQTWRLFSWPRGWAIPAGWADDGAGGIVSNDMLPTDIALPAAAVTWGTWLGNLTINGGTKNQVAGHPDCVDKLWGWEVLSANLGLHETGAGETVQKDMFRGWVDNEQRNAHLLDSIAAAGGVTASHTQSNADLALTETGGYVDVKSDTAFNADRNFTLPAAPTVGMRTRWKDVCTTAGGSLATHNLIVGAGGATNIQCGGPGGAPVGNQNETSWTVTAAMLGPGGVIEFEYVAANLWKVIG